MSFHILSGLSFSFLVFICFISEIKEEIVLHGQFLVFWGSFKKLHGSGGFDFWV
jgi:hypothetical protein